jgi:hypothetical protein
MPKLLQPRPTTEAASLPIGRVSISLLHINVARGAGVGARLGV